MARNNYSTGKRQRELEKARKKQEKAARRRERGSAGEEGIPLATAEEMQGNLEPTEDVVRRLLEGGAAVERQRRTVPSRLFIGGLAWTVTSDQLRAKFEALGPVDDAAVVFDRDTGDSRGFGFVTMTDRKDAAEAIRLLNGEELEGRALVVRQATERGR
ncbi:MAG: hypothetical protein OEY14_03250 [Myxococcales bacterium]|nr:hypothetical protein [Myxococcales bacterium]